MKFFADSYALVEYFKGNSHYLKYIDENEIVTTTLNLMELFYSALSDQGLEKAEEYFSAARKFTIEITDEHFKEACRFRFAHRGKNISYIDALGYIIAKTQSARFLTGDSAFKGMENVEWVK